MQLVYILHVPFSSCHFHFHTLCPVNFTHKTCTVSKELAYSICPPPPPSSPCLNWNNYFNSRGEREDVCAKERRRNPPKLGWRKNPGIGSLPREWWLVEIFAHPPALWTEKRLDKISVGMKKYRYRYQIPHRPRLKGLKGEYRGV